jgi:hypothetical protein
VPRHARLQPRLVEHWLDGQRVPFAQLFQQAAGSVVQVPGGAGECDSCLLCTVGAAVVPADDRRRGPRPHLGHHGTDHRQPLGEKNEGSLGHRRLQVGRAGGQQGQQRRKRLAMPRPALRRCDQRAAAVLQQDICQDRPNELGPADLEKRLVGDIAPAVTVPLSQRIGHRGDPGPGGRRRGGGAAGRVRQHHLCPEPDGAHQTTRAWGDSDIR